MATSTFEKKIIIRDSDAKKKLTVILESKPTANKLSKPLYTYEERKRSEQLLNACFSHYKHELK